MSIADILRFSAPLTNQQIADMALQSDRAAREARRAGRWADADRHQREADKLAGMLQ